MMSLMRRSGRLVPNALLLPNIFENRLTNLTTACTLFGVVVDLLIVVVQLGLVNSNDSILPGASSIDLNYLELLVVGSLGFT